MCTTCHGVYATSMYLRLSSIPNILSVASPSGKQEELVESLRVTGLPERTAQQDTQMLQAMIAPDHTDLLKLQYLTKEQRCWGLRIDSGEIDIQALKHRYSECSLVTVVKPQQGARLTSQERSMMPCWTHTSCRQRHRRKAPLAEC